mmetsp:Transcript_21534/g.46829  ORF Transcript_21534/g.46829 Transcript_21534/m.46829 type:complete len:689 (-) Transcript_21534:1025-3091(-)
MINSQASESIRVFDRVMSPYLEESMCTQSKQPGTVNAINTRQAPPPPPGETMEDNTNTGLDQQNIPSNNLGHNNNDNNNDNSLVHGEGNDSPRQRSSPSNRMRHRGQQSSSSRSVKTKNGRHVTNINRINVINNFGTDGASWKRNQRTSSITAKGQCGWYILRIVLASLILFWFGAMVTIMRGVPSPSSSKAQSKAALNLSRWKKLSELNIGFELRGGNTVANVVKPLLPVGVKAQDNPKDVTNISSAVTNNETASIFELSMFGNKSPSDFQLYTPHAPSCSKTLDTKSIAFTLVSQLSNDRVWMVQYHCERWGPNNPMSIVVFSDRTASDVKSELVSKGCSEEHLTVQTVGKTKYDPTGTEYPVNLLRNMAFSAVKTSHIVYADVDFWPASDLHSYLSDETVKGRFASDPKLATVVPVFQMSRRCKEYKDCRNKNIPIMPKGKNGLLNLIRKKKASTFDPTNVGGHGSTKYTTWRDQEERSFVDLPCIKSNRYEPYLAFRYCSELPPFQEGFTGYGKNKMTWVMQLRRAGYLFSQLGGAFLVHYPHLDSKARLEWNKKPKAMESKTASELLEAEAGDIDWGSFKRARVDALFLDFKEWLDGTVEDESRIPMCVDALNDDLRLWVHPNKGATDDEVSADEDTDDGENTDLEESQEDDDAEDEIEEEATNGGGNAEEAQMMLKPLMEKL